MARAYGNKNLAKFAFRFLPSEPAAMILPRTMPASRSESLVGRLSWAGRVARLVLRSLDGFAGE